MSRKQGSVKTGGRLKGSKNKKSRDQLNRAADILRLIETSYLEDDIAKLSPTARTSLYKDLIDFVQPRLQRVSHEGNDVLIINIEPKINAADSNQLASLGNSTSQDLLPFDK